MKPLVRNIILLVSMVAAASLALAFTPRQHLADLAVPIKLEKIVPNSFGEWKEIPSASAAVVDPGQEQLIEKIYTESLSRVYVNRQNYMIMLSIAYGRDQSDGFELHQPEICYPAQGFTVVSRAPHNLEMDGRLVNAMRLNTLGPRPEPLTYWTVVGTKNYQGGIAKKLIEMRYGFSGHIPDGMLVRISSVDTQLSTAYAAQANFAAAFVAALPEAVRNHFIGDPVH